MLPNVPHVYVFMSHILERQPRFPARCQLANVRKRMILLSIELGWRRRADLVHQTLRLTIKRIKRCRHSRWIKCAVLN